MYGGRILFGRIIDRISSGLGEAPQASLQRSLLGKAWLSIIQCSWLPATDANTRSRTKSFVLRRSIVIIASLMTIASWALDHTCSTRRRRCCNQEWKGIPQKRTSASISFGLEGLPTYGTIETFAAHTHTHTCCSQGHPPAA